MHQRGRQSLSSHLEPSFCRRSLLVAGALLLLGDAAWAGDDWPQWGGPNRNFVTSSPPLAETWPPGGPRILWQRPLGHGHSGIAISGDRLITMYSENDSNHVVCLNRKTGSTRWEYTYESPTPTDELKSIGGGPISTPLIVDDRVITIGANMRMHCLDMRSGRLLWEHALAEEFQTAPPAYGYSCSPIRWGDLVITAVGGSGHGIVAFRLEDGELAWAGGDFRVAYSSPILIRSAGRQQLVYFGADQIVGVDPATGSLIWNQPHVTQHAMNISSPIFNGSDLVFCSSAYDAGSRVIRLVRQDDRVVAEPHWYSRRMRVHFGTGVSIGNRIIASSGHNGPAFLSAVDFSTGKLAWRHRGLAKAHILLANRKLIILDEDGRLVLAAPTQTGLVIQGKCQILEHPAWTPPSLAGTTLYVRDRKQIKAIDLK